MQQVIQDLLWADITVWSFPLYYFTVPGLLKNLIDRQLPMLLPFMEEKEGQAFLRGVNAAHGFAALTFALLPSSPVPRRGGGCSRGSPLPP